MKQTKVFLLIEILSVAEWKELKKWLQSPWANTNKNLIRLYKALEKGFPDFEAKKWEKEIIYQKVYPSKPYKNKIFNNLLTEFGNQIRSFLTHTRVSQQSDLAEHLFITELMERPTTTLFEKAANDFVKNLEERHPKSKSDFWYLYQANQQLYYQTSAVHRLDPESMVLKKAMENLDIFYHWNFLKHQIDQQTRSIMLKIPANEPKKATENLTVQLLNEYLHRPPKWSLEAYQSFKKNYYQFFEELPLESKKDFLTCCINESVHPDGLAAMEGLKELFQHFEFGLAHQLFFHDGRMTNITFHNILLTASHLDKWEFAQAFLPSYLPYLQKPSQVDAQHWGAAELQYMQKNYEATLQIMNTHTFTTPFYKLQSVGLILRANFDRYLADDSYYDTLLSLCQAKEKYFQRSKLSKTRKVAYIRFVQYLKRLVGLNNTPDCKQKHLIAYQKELKNAASFYGKGWLHKKAGLMMRDTGME